jgi:hypothetical protein
MNAGRILTCRPTVTSLRTPSRLARSHRLTIDPLIGSRPRSTECGLQGAAPHKTASHMATIAHQLPLSSPSGREPRVLTSHSSRVSRARSAPHCARALIERTWSRNALMEQQAVHFRRYKHSSQQDDIAERAICMFPP